MGIRRRSQIKLKRFFAANLICATVIFIATGYYGPTISINWPSHTAVALFFAG